MENLSSLLSLWINRRDRIRFQNQLDGGGGQMEFLDQLDGHAKQLGDLLPQLNIAQMEALCELSSSRLAQMRMREAAFRNNG